MQFLSLVFAVFRIRISLWMNPDRYPAIYLCADPDPDTGNQINWIQIQILISLCRCT
jgi:hypothetical protein